MPRLVGRLYRLGVLENLNAIEFFVILFLVVMVTVIAIVRVGRKRDH